MPGLQDLRGQWSGSCQAYGGGGGATNVDFNLRGNTWSWGDFRLDQAIAKGSCHSEEGVQIEEFCLRAGTISLSADFLQLNIGIWTCKGLAGRSGSCPKQLERRRTQLEELLLAR